MASDTEVAARIKARREADLVADLAIGEAETIECRDVFMARLAERLFPDLLKRVDPPEPLKPLDDKQVAWFESMIVPFGMHKGKRVRDIPLSWLDWLTSQKMDEFKTWARRYLLRPETQTALDEERESNNEASVQS